MGTKQEEKWGLDQGNKSSLVSSYFQKGAYRGGKKDNLLVGGKELPPCCILHLPMLRKGMLYALMIAEGNHASRFNK